MTNAVIETIRSRRSIRAYESRQITREELETVVDAGLWAASGSNSQSWRITAVQNPEMLALINRTLKESLATLPITADTTPYFKRMINAAKEEGIPSYLFDAPSYVIVSNVRDYDNAMADSSLAIGNMMLAAHSIGLGTCWLNLLPRLKEFPEIRPLMDALSIPENHLVYGAIALGYPTEQPVAPPRKEGTVLYL